MDGDAEIIQTVRHVLVFATGFIMGLAIYRWITR